MAARRDGSVVPRLVVLAVLLGVTAAVTSPDLGQASRWWPAAGAPAGGDAVGADPRAPLVAAEAEPAPPPPPPPPSLPRGGRYLFPSYRLVGFSGGPGTAAFGRLGVGDIDDRVAEIEKLGDSYGDGRTVLPVLELIAVVAQPRPGDDGTYRVRVDPAVVDAYLAAARRHHGLLLLGIQPGRADFLDEVKAFERWLVEPDVGVALDPEWAVGPRQVPGRVFGSTTGKELDAVSAYLQGLVTEHDLPQKAMVVHQLAPRVIRTLAGLVDRPGVVVVKSVDGIGSPSQKTATWKRLVAGLPEFVHPGFKLFYEEDTRDASLMTPEQVLGLVPTPEYVLYE